MTMYAGTEASPRGKRRPWSVASVWSRSGGREVHRQRGPAPHLGVVELRLVQVDLPLGEARQDLLDGDAGFEARQRGAEAKVEHVPEGRVAVDRAGDVER